MTHRAFTPCPSWAARPAAVQVRDGHASWGGLSFPPAPPPRLLPGQRVVVWHRTWVSSLSASGSSVSCLSSGVLISPKDWQNQLPESGPVLSVAFVAVTECDVAGMVPSALGGVVLPPW